MKPRTTVRTHNRNKATELAKETHLDPAIFADSSDRIALLDIRVVVEE
jgi:hypothetical protein